MIRVIPRDLIHHLEWSPATDPKKQKIEALVNHGRVRYYNREWTYGPGHSGNCYVGISANLQHTLDEIQPNGFIPTLPLLIAGKAHANQNNYLWDLQNLKDFTGLSEQDMGIDLEGRLTKKGQAIIITTHGGGILTPDRIVEAQLRGNPPPCNPSIDSLATLTDEEFTNLLRGILPTGEHILLYTVDDIKRGIPDPFGRYAVWMPLSMARTAPSGEHTKNAFMESPVVLARAGTPDYLETFFEKARRFTQDKHSVCNYHQFRKTTPEDDDDDQRVTTKKDLKTPRGDLLSIGSTHIHDFGTFMYNTNVIGVKLDTP